MHRGIGSPVVPLLARLALVGAAMPWTPPLPNSADLLPFLRNTSAPKLAYSTYIGWYEDGGLNETSLYAQVDAMATKLRWGATHVCQRRYPR